MSDAVELGLDERVSADDVEDAARAARFRLVNLVPAGVDHPAQAIFTRDGGAAVLYYLEASPGGERRLVIAGASAAAAALDLRAALAGEPEGLQQRALLPEAR